MAEDIYIEHLDITINEDDLEEMPTLTEGHTQDLKIDGGDFRVWLSRMTVEDYAGAPISDPDFPIEYERRIMGRWVNCDRNGDPLNG